MLTTFEAEWHICDPDPLKVQAVHMHETATEKRVPNRTQPTEISNAILCFTGLTRTHRRLPQMKVRAYAPASLQEGVRENFPANDTPLWRFSCLTGMHALSWRTRQKDVGMLN